jgi:predicted AlkP superfamily phosphohydrolase/phosphomutase
MGKRKLIVLGLDGAEWDVVNALIGEGCLPNFMRMKQKGSYARLRSTIPPVTPVAWTSIFTGANPGKHGVFDFYNRDGELVTTKDTLLPFLWEQIPDKKFIVFNTPFTFPPRKSENSIIISGFGTPGLNCDFTYPAEIRKDIFRIVPDYDLDSGNVRAIQKRIALAKKHKMESSEAYNAFIAEFDEGILKSFNNRKAVAKHLIRNNGWDAAILVFSEPDWVQHEFMRHFFSSASKKITPVGKLYIEIDAFLGELLDEGHNVIIVSDHGFLEYERMFFMNSLLHEEGFLKRSPGLKQGAVSMVHKLAKSAFCLTPPWLIRMLKKSGRIKAFGWNLVMSKEDLGVDKSRSRAYLMDPVGGIFVRSQEDLPALAKLLEGCTDDEGRKLLELVLRREDIYVGPALRYAPHLVVLPAGGVALSARLSKARLNTDMEKEVSGGHKLHGVFLACGPDFENKGQLEDLSVYDITPTVLSFYSYSVPSYMDGKVIPLFEREKTGKTSISQRTRLLLGRIKQEKLRS